ncbi:hypothetical protein RJ639_033758 [Escallonia herrerae]|uniref:Ycf2 N-terminal domain-containing protein n=1 Tax=Escallonia herrerae TaxID=1293975 RepID=A0AA88WT46_9ASTE|nr:hypothetical protein RJ639_033758 [Escallonia herrerae]
MLLSGGSTYGVKSILSKKKYLNINLIDFVSIIPNPITGITFLRNKRHLITFIMVFLNMFLDNKPKSFLIDDTDIDESDDIDASDNIDCDLDTELELLTMMNALIMDMMPEIDRFYITL